MRMSPQEHRRKQDATYERKWYGCDLLAIDRWFPSSKTCSVGGSEMEAMPLQVHYRAAQSVECGMTATSMLRSIF